MTITEYFYQECSTPDDTNLLETFVDLFSEDWDKYTPEMRDELGEILRDWQHIVGRVVDTLPFL